MLQVLSLSPPHHYYRVRPSLSQAPTSAPMLVRLRSLLVLRHATLPPSPTPPSLALWALVPRATNVVSLLHAQTGFAVVQPAASSLTLGFKVTNNFPTAGSVMGGSLIVISGKGFSTNSRRTTSKLARLIARSYMPHHLRFLVSSRLTRLAGPMRLKALCTKCRAPSMQALLLGLAALLLDTPLSTTGVSLPQ